MNSVILCEGHDELVVVGRYLVSRLGWGRKVDGRYHSNYDFPVPLKENGDVRVYQKTGKGGVSHRVAVFSVNGVSNFSQGLKTVSQLLYLHEEEGIEQVFLMQDRDNLQENDQLSSLETLIEQSFLQGLEQIPNHIKASISDPFALRNHESSLALYPTSEDVEEGELLHTRKVAFIPVLLPVNQGGAIEDVILDGMCDSNTPHYQAHQNILEEARTYVKVVHNKMPGGQVDYLRRERLRTKAVFSAFFSITTPTHCFVDYRKLLTSSHWEQSPIMESHFKAFHTFLG